MIQFNIHRVAQLARWSLTNDRRYYIKAFFQVLVVMLFTFLFFTYVTNTHVNYQACAGVVFMMFAINVVMGPSFMFYSMEGKHDCQTLMLLPSSNFEKYLMRYATWILLLPLYLVAFFAADLMQYFFHWVLGHEYGQFVLSRVIKIISDINRLDNATPRFVVSIVALVIWLQSIYALGATFFRSRKFNWVLTTALVILLGMFLFKHLGDAEVVQLRANAEILEYVISMSIYIVLAMFNYWLSYRLFCRMQAKAKWINL